MDPPPPDAARGVYGISVAAELVGMGPQTLRLYERRGLLEPARTDGGTRRYSEDDLARLRRIGELLGGGLNLAGVAVVLDLETDNARLRTDNTQLRKEREGTPMVEYRADSPGDIPEADLLEQQIPVDTDLEELTVDHGPAAMSAARSGQADEPDLLEQSRPLPGEEDHPPGPADD
jgi:MerR family transcriptional regulator/heat shock protein HspR